MKKILLALLVSAAAYAQVDGSAVTKLTCVVPVEGKTPVITAVIEAVEESQGDFMTITISEPGKELLYYNQLEKGAFRNGLATGSLVTLVIQEGAGLDNGAIRGAGLVVISKDATGLQGFASLNNTFYPLSCQQ